MNDMNIDKAIIDDDLIESAEVAIKKLLESELSQFKSDVEDAYKSILDQANECKIQVNNIIESGSEIKGKAISQILFEARCIKSKLISLIGESKKD